MKTRCDSTRNELGTTLNVRRKLGLIAELLTILSGVFFFDYSGVPLAWSMLANPRESKPRKSKPRKSSAREVQKEISGRNIFCKNCLLRGSGENIARGSLARLSLRGAGTRAAHRQTSCSRIRNGVSKLLKLTSTASTVVMCRRVSFLNCPCVSIAYANLIRCELWPASCTSAP